MPFAEVDIKKEQQEFDKLLKNPTAKKTYEVFEKEYEFRKKLAEVRKSNSITQKELQMKTGLPQQSISRIEQGINTKQSPTLKTLLRYVDALGYELTITRK